MSKAEIGLPFIERTFTARAEWCEPLGVQYGAFSHELPPESLRKRSRVRRVVPLKTASVSALLKAAPNFRRIAGGTAEGLPFVPIAGMMGIFYFSYKLKVDN